MNFESEEEGEGENVKVSHLASYGNWIFFSNSNPSDSNKIASLWCESMTTCFAFESLFLRNSILLKKKHGNQLCLKIAAAVVVAAEIHESFSLLIADC